MTTYVFGLQLNFTATIVKKGAKCCWMTVFFLLLLKLFSYTVSSFLQCLNFFQCSKSCGEGIKRRQLKCTYKSRSGKIYHVRSKRCKRIKKPDDWKADRTATCLVRSCLTTVAMTTTPTPTTVRTTSERLRRIEVNERESALQTGLTEAGWITGNWQQVGLIKYYILILSRITTNKKFLILLKSTFKVVYYFLNN